jgi:hypothetical protein
MLIDNNIIPEAEPLDNSPNSNACLYMYSDAGVLANNGLPPVIIKGISKKFIDQIVINMMSIIMNDLIMGSVR